MSVWTFAAAGCASVAGWLLTGRRPIALDRLAPARDAPASWSGRRLATRSSLRRRMTAGRRSQHGRESIIELADALAAELRTGAAPRTAMLRAAEGEPLLHWVAVAARSPAGDVAAALRDLAALPGAAGAADLATAWSVTETTGGSLADPVGRIAGGLRDDEQVRREVSAQLAGPRATAVLLAVLPLFGLLLGSALGAAPLPLLVASPVGPVLLVPGLLLELAGVLWTLRITRRAGPRDG